MLSLMRAGVLLISGMAGCTPPNSIEPSTPEDEVVTPEGDKGIALECGAIRDCYGQAATRCPDGYEVVDQRERGSEAHSTGGCVPVGKTMLCGSNASQTNIREMVIRCKAGVHPEDAARFAPPEGAAGFLFEGSPTDIEKACTGAGHEWDETTKTCSGAASDVGVPVESRLSFCAEKLCKIDLVVTSPPGQWLKVLTTLRTALGEKYGESAKGEVDIPQECRTQEKLGDCFTDGAARLSVEWVWPDKHAVILVVDQKPPAIHVRYYTPAAVRAMRAQGL